MCAPGSARWRRRPLPTCPQPSMPCQATATRRRCRVHIRRTPWRQQSHCVAAQRGAVRVPRREVCATTTRSVCRLRQLRARAAGARLRRNLDSCAYTAAQCAGPVRGGCGAAAAAAAAQPRFRGAQLCGSGCTGSVVRRAASRTLAQRVAEARARRASIAGTGCWTPSRHCARPGSAFGRRGALWPPLPRHPP